MDGLKKWKAMVNWRGKEKGLADGMYRMGLKALWVFILSFFVGIGFLGCSTLPAKPAEQAISYDLTDGVEVTKVSFYMKKPRDLPHPVCWVDVSIQNISSSEQSFLVLVQVDDEPGVSLRTKKPLGPKKEDTLSLITIKDRLPARLAVVVTH